MNRSFMFRSIVPWLCGVIFAMNVLFRDVQVTFLSIHMLFGIAVPSIITLPRITFTRLLIKSYVS